MRRVTEIDLVEHTGPALVSPCFFIVPVPAVTSTTTYKNSGSHVRRDWYIILQRRFFNIFYQLCFALRRI
jgi:hypothetical protein